MSTKKAAAKKAPAKKAASAPRPVQATKANPAKVVQSQEKVALFFDQKGLKEADRQRLKRFAKAMGLTVMLIRDGGPTPPPSPQPPLPGVKSPQPAKKRALAKKKPGTP
jgi:hypothetical protein